LEAALTERTRALLFCSPHNPTGVVHSRDDLEIIADVAREHDLFVIVDEIYERTTWQSRRHLCIASLDGMEERTIGLMGLTKTASMGGWRIGFAYGPEPVITAMERIQQHAMTCASSIGQSAATHAFGEPPTAELLEYWSRWELSCSLVTSTLDALPGLACAMPEGGFYAWLDVRSTGIPSTEIAQRLLEEQQVAVVPGAAFGPMGEGCVRITCVRSNTEIATALERLTEFFTGSD
jgi:aspartate/methionine/tyrosine aminotransferase